jgi:hypothetical protein
MDIYYFCNTFNPWKYIRPLLYIDLLGCIYINSLRLDIPYPGNNLIPFF